ncbi:MAG: LytTR family transcriptional regulator [Alistipes sp.]|nr:LytTR family transcriptional regulator [Rikenellaceae bacterium]MBQ3212127.1 LytTR family transcriptional regulator [Alistipes sp.]
MQMTPIPSFIYKRSNQITMIIFVPIFALFFIALYSPFDFDRIDSDAHFLSWLNVSRELLVQLITIFLILIGMAVAAISRWLMALYTRKRQISYVHYIAWIACEILVMTLMFTIVALFTDTNKGIITLFKNSLIKTFLMLLIPYTLCYIYFIWQERVAQLRMLRERIAEDETALQAAYVQIFDEKGEMRLSVRREHLLLIESADNYICVWYTNNNAPKKVLVRNTLKQVAEQLASTHIQRCHRSYLVNLDHVKVLRREKEGIFVELGIVGVPDVPISKTYSDSIQKWLMTSPVEA